MSSPASAMGSHAAPVMFEWRGQQVEIKPMNWGGIICALENWLIEREADVRVSVMIPMVEKRLLPPEVMLERQLAFADEAVNSGRYGFGSPRMMSIFKAAFKPVDPGADPETPQESGIQFGLLKLWSLMTGLDVNETLEIMSDQKVKAEFMTKMVVVMSRSLPPRGGDGPNLMGAAVKPTPPRPNTGGVVQTFPQ